jgi:hypothetical protein
VGQRTEELPLPGQDGGMTKRIAWLLAVLMALSFPMGAQALNKKLTKRSYMDARHCLDLPTRTEIVRCAERYM